MLANFNVQKAIEKVSVTDDEIKEYYEENKENFKKGESVTASHILVDDEDKAKEILEKIEKGEMSFEDAAREYSSCPSSQNGGALGEFTRGQMVPEFDKAVFEMEKGAVSGPVKTQFGFHIIKVTDKSDAQEMKLEDIKEQLRGMVLGSKRQKALDSKLNQLKILYPVDKM
ncbi:MAG: peptidyl-prolyl cis-trans isomerase [Clostridia bacterium]|nr:peptidyl-prolyl cis-trans isomerase [Clostridia bacterium]